MFWFFWNVWLCALNVVLYVDAGHRWYNLGAAVLTAFFALYEGVREATR